MEKELVSQLFKQHYPSMYKRARTFLYNELESKDVVSDIFERLLSSDIALNADTAGQYLQTCVRNECLKRLQMKSNRQRMEQLYIQDLQQDEPTSKDEERLQKLKNFAHTHLTPQEQTTFRLRFIEGMSYEEIGEEMGISRVAVWKHLSHLMKTIKQQFKISEL